MHTDATGFVFTIALIALAVGIGFYSPALGFVAFGLIILAMLLA